MLKGLFYLSFLFFFFFSCKKDPSVFVIKNLNGNKIEAFGHGGMGINYRYPMNTLKSLNECLNMGVRGTEMDVCVTKDSVLVLSHNQRLEDNTSCTGLIKEMTWLEIMNCTYRSPIYTEKENLVKASDFFNQLHNRNNFIFTFDCKLEAMESLDYLNRFAYTLLRHIDNYEMGSNSFIESYNTTFLKILKSRNKSTKLFVNTQNIQAGLLISKNVELYGLTLATENISEEEILEAHRNNLRVTLFNTHTEHENLEAIAKNPDFIQTDRVEFLVNALIE
jgi:glycerophosphoryl diester phosphodiesterase